MISIRAMASGFNGRRLFKPGVGRQRPGGYRRVENRVLQAHLRRQRRNHLARRPRYPHPGPHPLAFGGTEPRCSGRACMARRLIWMVCIWPGSRQCRPHPGHSVSGDLWRIVHADYCLGNVNPQSSDIITLPVTAGTWYVASQYGNGGGAAPATCPMPTMPTMNTPFGAVR